MQVRPHITGDTEDHNQDHLVFLHHHQSELKEPMTRFESRFSHTRNLHFYPILHQCHVTQEGGRRLWLSVWSINQRVWQDGNVFVNRAQSVGDTVTALAILLLVFPCTVVWLCLCANECSTIEKDALSLLLALHTEVYVGSSLLPVAVYTDRNPLVFVPQMQNSNGRLVRWLLFVQDFNLEICRKKGAFSGEMFDF